MTAARRNFWLAWVAATVAGGLLSLAASLWVIFPAANWMLGSVPASNLRDGIVLADNALAQVAGAAIMAIAQAYVLRRVLGRGVTWVTAAIVGSLLAWFAVHWLLGQLTPKVITPALATGLDWRVEGLIMRCSATLLTASAVWIACLRDRDRSGLFIVASVAASAVLFWYAPAFAVSPLVASGNATLVSAEFSLLGGLVSGAMTGAVLAFTLLRPRPTRRTPARHPAKRTARRRPARAASR